MPDKHTHTFTFKVEGIALDHNQVREISDAISGAAAGALLRHGHRGGKQPIAPPKQPVLYDWHGPEGIAGGIWALVEEGLTGIDVTKATQVLVHPSATAPPSAR